MNLTELIVTTVGIIGSIGGIGTLIWAIFSNTQSVSEHSFSADLFKNPIVELTDENKTLIKETTDKYFKAFVQVAVNGLIGK